MPATPFPGFDSPAVGFEQPYEMLEACHARVQRSLDLLSRLVTHVDERGHDAQTRSAAADVLRYFDIAAPLHHADEEVHVFPLLLAQGNTEVRAAVLSLQDDHRRMSALWASLRQTLLRWSQPGVDEGVDEASRRAVASFHGIYAKHLKTEEGLVFPSARALMNENDLASMSRQMQARRQT